jgi:polysaccharide biosynthesis transport protein
MSEENNNTSNGSQSGDSGGKMVRVLMDNKQMLPMKSGLRPVAEPDSGITANFLLETLRRWWLAAVPTGLVLAAIGAVVVYLTFEPKYEARAILQIESTNFLSPDSNFEGHSKTFIQTQIDKIKLGVIPDIVPEIQDLPEIAKNKNEGSDPAVWLQKQIKIIWGESDMLHIIYTSPTKRSVADVVNKIAKKFVDLASDYDSTRNVPSINKLKIEYDLKKTEVIRTRNALIDWVKNNPGNYPFSNKMGIEAMPKRPLDDIQSRMDAVEVERYVLQSKINVAKAAIAEAAAKAEAAKVELDKLKVQEAEVPAEPNVAAETPSNDSSGTAPPANDAQPQFSKQDQDIGARDPMVDKFIEENVEVQRLKGVIQAKQSQLTDIEAKAKLGQEDPSYRRLAEEIRRDEETLDRLRKKIRPGIVEEANLYRKARQAEMEAALADKREEELRKLQSDLESLDFLQQELKKNHPELTEAKLKGDDKEARQQDARQQMEFASLYADWSRAQEMLDRIAARILQLQTEQNAPARISVYRPANEPQDPVESKPYRNMILASLAGFCLPFLLVVAWERIMKRVSDPRQLEQQSNMLVLGEIARLPARKHASTDANKNGFSQDLRVFEESVDSLRTGLILSEDLRNMRFLSVTSAVNGEGKTSLSAQLATSIARASNESVLLIDGDMRSPDIHTIFQIPLEPGLVGVLGKECSLEAAIVTSWSKNVHFLPAGRLKSSPHRLLSNGNWIELLASIPGTYRHVIIDTPPILAASESLVLNQGADASLICVMRDVSRMDQVRKACERLIAAGGHPIGTVLNGIPTRHYSYRYGSYAHTHD